MNQLSILRQTLPLKIPFLETLCPLHGLVPVESNYGAYMASKFYNQIYKKVIDLPVRIQEYFSFIKPIKKEIQMAIDVKKLLTRIKELEDKTDVLEAKLKGYEMADSHEVGAAEPVETESEEEVSGNESVENSEPETSGHGPVSEEGSD